MKKRNQLVSALLTGMLLGGTATATVTTTPLDAAAEESKADTSADENAEDGTDQDDEKKLSEETAPEKSKEEKSSDEGGESSDAGESGEDSGSDEGGESSGSDEGAGSSDEGAGSSDEGGESSGSDEGGENEAPSEDSSGEVSAADEEGSAGGEENTGESGQESSGEDTSEASGGDISEGKSEDGSKEETPGEDAAGDEKKDDAAAEDKAAESIDKAVAEALEAERKAAEKEKEKAEAEEAAARKYIEGRDRFEAQMELAAERQKKTTEAADRAMKLKADREAAAKAAAEKAKLAADKAAQAARRYGYASSNRAYYSGSYFVTNAQKRLALNVGFTKIEKTAAMAAGKEDVQIRELKSDGGRVVGTLSGKDICYIVADKGSDWVYVESGEVRGFVRGEQLKTGEEVSAFANTVGEEGLTTAAQTVDPLDNTAYRYSLNTTKDVASILQALGTASVDRQAMISFAEQFIGNPYVWGGESLTQGCDCSGFTQQVYAQFGIALPRTSYEQADVGVKLPKEEAIPGDLLFYARDGVVYHVLMYIGDGKAINASSSSTGIVIQDVDYSKVCWACRYISESGASAVQTAVQMTSTQASSLQAIGQMASNGDRAAQEEIISALAQASLKEWRTYGFCRSVIIAQAINESGWLSFGSSAAGIQSTDNNILGMNEDLNNSLWASPWDGKAATRLVPQYVGGGDVYNFESMRLYDDMESCMEDYAAFKVSLHPDLIGETDVNKVIAVGLQGYATNPNYQSDIRALIDRFDLTRFDHEETGAMRPEEMTAEPVDLFLDENPLLDEPLENEPLETVPDEDVDVVAAATDEEILEGDDDETADDDIYADDEEAEASEAAAAAAAAAAAQVEEELVPAEEDDGETGSETGYGVDVRETAEAYEEPETAVEELAEAQEEPKPAMKGLEEAEEEEPKPAQATEAEAPEERETQVKELAEAQEEPRPVPAPVIVATPQETRETEVEELAESQEEPREAEEAGEAAADTENTAEAAEAAPDAEAAEASSEAEEHEAQEEANVVTNAAGVRIDTSDYSEQELEIIWAVVAQEDDTSYDGALAVISSVMNRADLNYGGFGETAFAQITAESQYAYSPDVEDPLYIERRLGGNVPDFVKQAVSDCLKNGIRNNSYTSFRVENTVEGSVRIGANWYFYETAANASEAIANMADVIGEVAEEVPAGAIQDGIYDAPVDESVPQAAPAEEAGEEIAYEEGDATVADDGGEVGAALYEEEPVIDEAPEEELPEGMILAVPDSEL